MEIISWNVNSVRARLPRVAALLARRQPDVVCLQDIKVSPADFPVAEFAALGYAFVERVMERLAAKFQCRQRYRCDPPCCLCRSGYGCEEAGPS